MAGVSGNHATLGHYVAANKEQIAKALGVDPKTSLWGEGGLVNQFALLNNHKSIYEKDAKTGDTRENSIFTKMKPEELAHLDKDVDSLGQMKRHDEMRAKFTAASHEPVNPSTVAKGLTPPPAPAPPVENKPPLNLFNMLTPAKEAPGQPPVPPTDAPAKAPAPAPAPAAPVENKPPLNLFNLLTPAKEAPTSHKPWPELNRDIVKPENSFPDYKDYDFMKGVTA